jgi:hypothetical protein
MAGNASLLEELRREYEAARASPHVHADVPDFQTIDKHMRAAFRWLEKAVAYLDGLKPPLAHRFDLGNGLAFAQTRFDRGFVGQHEQRIVGYPVLDEINISYTMVAAAPPALEVAPGSVPLVQRTLDDAGLQYTARHVADHEDVLRKCALTVAPRIPAAIAMRVDYRTGTVTVTLTNVDRFDRVSLEFRSAALDEAALEDLVRLILGRGDAFLHRAPLAGVHGTPAG